MDMKRCTTLLLAGLLLLPIAILATLGIAVLLAAMGDDDGGRWLGRLAAVVGIVWTVDLVALVAAAGVSALGCCRDPNGPPKVK